MFKRSSISLRNLVISHLVILLVVSVIGVGILFVLHNQNVLNIRHADNQDRVALFSSHVSQVISVYRGIVRSIAKRNDTIDLLHFPDRSLANSWAANMRDYLPRSIGIALIDEEGRVLGDPPTLRIGDRCMRDIDMLTHGNSIDTPAVHDDVEGMEHFDIISVVTDEDGVIIGRIFVSFSLDIIGEILGDNLRSSEHVELLLRGNESFLNFGGTVSGSYYEAPVDGTSWAIKLWIPESNGSDYLHGIAIIAAACVLLLSIVMWILARNLGKTASQELEHINDMLDSLYDTNSRARIMREVRLKESEELVEHINDIADRLIDREAKLEDYGKTDQLTGMHNRYVADDLYTQLMAAVKRGVYSALVMVDLDSFKRCNEACGHAHGDRVLKLFSKCMVEAGEGSDDSLRFSGTEFITMLFDVDEPQLEAWYQRLSTLFTEAQRKHIKDEPEHVTCGVSAGAVLVQDPDFALEEVLEVAEEQLLLARSRGGSGIAIVTTSTLRQQPAPGPGAG